VATSLAPSPGNPPSRRNFYVGAIYAIGAWISASLGLPAIAYLFLPPKAVKPDEWIEIGDADSLSRDAPTEMTFRRNRVDGWKVISERGTAWLVRSASNEIVAFGPQCTHLGCAYHWDEGRDRFVCPCHNSVFDMGGKVTAGPAPRPLDRYDLKVESGRLKLGQLRHSGDAKA